MGMPRKSKVEKGAAGGAIPPAKSASTSGSRKKPPAAGTAKRSRATATGKVKGKPQARKPAQAATVLSGPKGARAGAAAKAKPAAPKPTVRKPAVDDELLKQLREALVHQRQRMLSVVRSTKAQMAEKTKDLPDVSDQASEGYGDELAVGLMAIEAAQLEDIDAAIQRIDAGTYGLCLDCGKPIPRKRLEVLPFACRCLACVGAREMRVRTQAAYEEEEDS